AFALLISFPPCTCLLLGANDILYPAIGPDNDRGADDRCVSGLADAVSSVASPGGRGYSCPWRQASMLPQRVNMHVRSSAALLLWGLLAIGLIARASPAAAHSPPGVDPSLAPWFRSLQEPVNNGSCCAERDCELIRAKIARDHYEVFLEGAWR